MGFEHGGFRVMVNGYRFDEVARAERYFADTLLPHFLMSNNFTGLQLLFQRIFGDEVCSKLDSDFEVVSEVDALRDASVFHPEVKKLYRDFGRVAVPDLFLRWSTVCLVIEAKFFTDPAGEDLKIQVNKQREAITKVKPYTYYKDSVINYAVLTLNKSPISRSGDSTIVISWDDILELIQISRIATEDIVYCFRVIQNAKAKAAKELVERPRFQKMKYDELMRRLPDLIREGKIFIGFTGGIVALSKATESELVNRGHYKVSEIRLTDNWLSIDQFLHRLLEVRGLLAEM
jgi:hypothetical protein